MVKRRALGTGLITHFNILSQTSQGFRDMWRQQTDMPKTYHNQAYKEHDVICACPIDLDIIQSSEISLYDIAGHISAQ